VSYKFDNNEELKRTLDNILSHKIFASSSRAIAFLDYIITEASENRADEINGTTIAQDVFGKGAEFDAMQDSTVRVYARRLRSMLKAYYTDHPDRDPLIITIPKGGYKPRIERNPAHHSAQMPQAILSPKPRAKFPRWAKILSVLSILPAGMLLAASVSGDLFPSKTMPPANPKKTAYSPLSANQPKIAVGLFKNNTGVEDYNFLEQALQKKLVEDLSRFNLIRPTIHQGRYEAIIAAGPAENDYAISGMILSVEPTLDIYLKLIDVKNSTILFDRRIKRASRDSDYFDSISEIVSELSGNVAGLEGVIVKRQMDDIRQGIEKDTLIVSNLQSFECYTLAGALMENPNPETYSRVYTCLDNLVKDDPNNATLLTTFGWINFVGAKSNESVLMARSINPDISAEQAYLMMQRAAEIDPTNAEAHQNLSAYHYINEDIQAALRHAELAAVLNPGNPDNLTWLSKCLTNVGQWDRAIIFAQDALDRNSDPSSDYYHTFFKAGLHSSDAGAMQDAADKIAALDDYYAVVFSFLAAVATDDQPQIKALRPELDAMLARNNNNVKLITQQITQSAALSAKAHDLFVKGGIVPTSSKDTQN
jgi:tetratricopeptide (TPR) repeat protein